MELLYMGNFRKGGRMNAYKVTFEDGNTLVTNFNGSIKDASVYYIGTLFQFGDTEEHPTDMMVMAVKVEAI
jgi:hypothetical protein